ncbi:hypothetical protein [Singulisphaera sp. PoT]|uniref:hypothetical protein n=1 Tax=Singulisphaera sp. PoT TaxID=3411797 RepID=UPI003BF5A865
MDRFFVKAPSVNAVRRALGRAPGGVRVVGRFDRDTIECRHTMSEHSLGRLWAVIVSRLAKEGLTVVERPGESTQPQTFNKVETPDRE